MNRREKKKLRKKYLNLIDNKIEKITYQHSRTISLLQELKDIISNIDFKIFYHLHSNNLLPNKTYMDHYYCDMLENKLNVIKKDELVNRDYSLNSLLNEI